MNLIFKILKCNVLCTIICAQFLISCSQEKNDVPGFDNVAQNWEHIDRSDMALALFITYLEWEKTFGDEDKKLHGSVNHMKVIWLEEIENPDKDSEYEMYGNTLNYDLSIRIKQQCSISCTSFTHEFVHFSLWAINKHIDYDHEGTKYPGWTKKHTIWMRDTQKILEAAGL